MFRGPNVPARDRAWAGGPRIAVKRTLNCLPHRRSENQPHDAVCDGRLVNTRSEGSNMPLEKGKSESSGILLVEADADICCSHYRSDQFPCHSLSWILGN